MRSLWWPGDHRAGELMSDAAFLRALLEVEQAWLRVLAEVGVAPGGAVGDVTGLVGEEDLGRLAIDAEAGGNPVIPLVALLRERLPASTADWVHRGLTSQDVVDTALMLCARDAVAAVRDQVVQQAARLAQLAGEHRNTPMVARTLTQHAVPTTFGAKAASWLQGVLDADDDLAALRFPVQVGGAAGTLSGLVELAGADRARLGGAHLARELGLTAAAPWHTARATVTRIGDAAVRSTDAWGRIANDVLLLGRPEVGEVAESSGGGSSTMPQKANPVRALLVRRTALAAPSLAATLHLASADQVDERAAGAWHVEWDTLATLLRRTAVAAAHTTDLLVGLVVLPAQMAARLEGARAQVRQEQQVMAGLVGRDPTASYDGLAGHLVDETLERARVRGAGSPSVAPSGEG
jgi:3-carboxy-cis,cis-muconate cycloisomerase